jgi:hypothetical protein
MKRLFICLFIPAILLAANRASAEAAPLTNHTSATINPAPTPLPSGYAVGPTYFPKEVNPLSGLPAPDPSLLERRPIAIKVTNFPRSVRPQWGLSAADHVYEYYIGDQMSRFIGIFYSADASRVGPVRSARLFDEHILRMYRSLLVFGWADDPVLEFLTQPDIRPLLVVERANNCPPLCRIGPKYAYNTLFADTTQIAAYLADHRVNNARQKLTGLRFAAETPKSGHSAAELSIRYSEISYHRWEYDAVQGRYLRFQETQDDYGKGAAYAPLRDSLSGSQLSAANIVVLLVPHEYYIRYSNTDIIDQVLEGDGFGYALRDGQLYPLTWEHAAPDQLLKLVLPDGHTYPLKPGNTWFEVLSDLSQLKENGNASWHFDFVLPD